MHKSHKDKVASGSASDNTAQRLAERTAKRSAIQERKRKEAEELKEQGNKHFREQHFQEAALCYERAIMTYGPRKVYVNNLAAAYLKLERWKDAEDTADQLLRRDPTLDKARYRRALARKGSGHYRAAIADLNIVLDRDPSCADAQKALSDAQAALRLKREDAKRRRDSPYYASRDDDDGAWDDADDEETDLGSDASDMEDLMPEDELAEPLPHHPSADDGRDTPTLSDTSDFEHAGNGVPCRYYNHGGCARGVRCTFRHAPDDRSVRDDLGRNVCLFYLLGLCKFGAAQCVYAHDRTHLSRGPWDDREWAPRMRNMLGPVRGAHSAPMLEQLAPLLKPDQPLHARGFLPTERVRALERATFAYAVSYDDDDDDGAPAGRRRGRAHRRWEEEEDEAEMEERMANMGFSNAELGDLLAQGVKPWDDDAWDVLHALQSF